MKPIGIEQSVLIVAINIFGNLQLIRELIVEAHDKEKSHQWTEQTAYVRYGIIDLLERTTVNKLFVWFSQVEFHVLVWDDVVWEDLSVQVDNSAGDVHFF